MAGSPEGPSPEPKLEGLRIDLERAATHGQAILGAAEAFRVLNRQTISRLATGKESVNSADGLELAFSYNLGRFNERLSPRARSALLEYMVDFMPAAVEGYRPGDPYFQATHEVFGINALFEHIMRGVEIGDPNQLTLDI